MMDSFDEAVERHPSTVSSSGSGRRSSRRPLLVGAVVVVVALLTALFAFGLSRDPTLVKSVVVDRRAPDFALRTIDGTRTVRLAELHGQVVVVNFWASWCRDCIVEHGSLQAAWDRYRDQGVVLLGVAFNDKVDDSLAFARRLRMDWPLLADPGSRTAIAFGVYGVPETFVIGPDGTVAFKQVGPIPYAVLSDRISRALRVAAA
jgi:cytochrome c biogenesis protein CcmG, thiol:disulfide interchange protein DsbE